MLGFVSAMEVIQDLPTSQRHLEHAIWHHELHPNLARHHRALGLGIEADMTHDRLSHAFGGDHLADPAVRDRSP
jgi:hypothetical protein